MSANPVDLITGLATTANVSKADISAWAKARVQQLMANASEIRSTILGSQLSVTLKSTGSNFFLDTTDSTTADDGVNCIISADGFRFKRVAFITTRAQRIVTAAGAVTILPTDDIVIIRKTVGAATTVNVDWSQQPRPLTIVDGKPDAATNNITIIPSTGQTQYGTADYQVVIDGNGGQVTLTPLSDGSGAF